MIAINPSIARNLSRLGTRGTFGLALLDVGAENENLLVLSADLCTTSGLDRFRSAYPERFFNTGIAEQNMLGIAGGLAKEGYKVFCSSFATFVSMRSYEMVRLNLGYMAFNIKVVGLAAGFAMGMFGNTHYATEDIALMRAVPGLCILSPADCGEVVKATRAAALYEGPVYLRLTGQAGNPIVYDHEYNFEIGRAVMLREGTDIAIIATGSMVYESLEAAKLLEPGGLSAAVIDMHTIKPLDTSAIERALEKKLIVTVEEHSVVGGLGGAVAEYKCGLNSAPPQLILGIADGFKKAGSYRYMLEQNGLTASHIADSISEAWHQQNPRGASLP
jgi:transketolase